MLYSVCKIYGKKENKKKLYEQQYEAFQKWWRVQNVQKLTENAVLVYYFDEKSKVVCSSTLWAHYSMLKSVNNIRKNVDIKKKMRDLNQKKSNVLTIEQVDQFLREAPDDEYLVMKVALIAGVAGACRGKELVDLEVNDVGDMGDFFLITVRNTQNKVNRNLVNKNSENSIDIVKIFRKNHKRICEWFQTVRSKPYFAQNLHHIVKSTAHVKS
ncbi:hypothetical protein NQ317_013810 [Molorchus minor]|uniref:Tyr recombinase domain-containing protein n=1 Tax=Molorchus minor TaxID=1323400 RepID=A0ABQ9JS90_9CUCU|nr:hypothetical protein NQ317_013810 [Molorchus minor]